MARRNTYLPAIWTGLLMTAAVTAVVVTLMVAAPRSSRDDAAGSPVWNSVLPAQVNATIDANAVVWGERWYSDLAVARARTTANRFFGSLAGGPRHATGQRLLSRRGASSGTALVDWAANLPGERVTTSVTDSRLVGNWQNGIVHVRGRLDVKVHQALKGSQTFTTNLDLRLKPAGITQLSKSRLAAGKGALSLQPPAAWRIYRARADRQGLRMFEHPLLVTGPVADIVADNSHASDARAYRAEEGIALTEERKKWSKSSPPGSLPSITTVFLVDTPGFADRLLHHGATPEGVHASGWTFENGDVVLLNSELVSRSATERLGVVRHEMTHVATLPLLTTIPTLFFEGVATVEETTRSTAGTNRYLDLRLLLRAFNAGRLHYAELLVSRKTSFGLTNPDRIALGYLAGFATVKYIDEKYGHEALQKLLLAMNSGASVDAALSEVLQITPQQLADNTLTWTSAQVHNPVSYTDVSASPSSGT